MGLLLISANAAYAEDTYLCDGVIFDKEKQTTTDIPDTKFQVKHATLSLEIKNLKNNKEWTAFRDASGKYYQNGNVVLMIYKEKEKTTFSYHNLANNQRVIFENCTVPTDF